MPSAALLELGTVYRHFREGREREARRVYYGKCLPFIEIRLALRHITTEVLHMAGIIRSPRVRHPWPASFDRVTRLVSELDLAVLCYRRQARR